jgi:hypothetical protein
LDFFHHGSRLTLIAERSIDGLVYAWIESLAEAPDRRYALLLQQIQQAAINSL